MYIFIIQGNDCVLHEICFSAVHKLVAYVKFTEFVVPCKYTSCCPCDFTEIHLFPTVNHMYNCFSIYFHRVDVYLVLCHLFVRTSFGRKLRSSGKNMYVVTVTAVTLLTLYMLTWRIWWALNNAGEGQMGFNSAFRGLSFVWLKWVRIITLLNFMSFLMFSFVLCYFEEKTWVVVPMHCFCGPVPVCCSECSYQIASVCSCALNSRLAQDHRNSASAQPQQVFSSK